MRETLFPRFIPKSLSVLISCLFILFFLSPLSADQHAAPDGETMADSSDEALHYVGSSACMNCHEDEYANFTTYAKKSKSYQSIERMKKGLTEKDLENCYRCHTTGYGKPGGFVSEEETPELKNAGCEVCHGPGSLHLVKQDKKSINAMPTMKVCDRCHTSERLRAFRFRPLIHGGGH